MGRMRRRSIGSWAGLSLALLALAGCARLGMGGGSGGAAAKPTEPAPMPPSLAMGDTFTFEDNGVQVKEQVTGFAGPRTTWQNDRGVSWVQAADVISPPISWSGDPRLGQGNQQIFGDPSKLFPLEPGKTVKFQVAGVSEKLPDGWQAENSCTVVNKEPMTVKAGTFQTWRIACQRGEVLETIYYVPDIMTYALRTRERGNQPPYEKKELVAYDLAQAPDRKLPAMAASDMKSEDHARHGQTMAAAPAATAAAAPAMAAASGGDVARRIDRLEAQVAQLERLTGQTPAAPGQPRSTTPPRAAAAASAAAPAADAKPMMASAGNGRFGAHLGSYRTINEAKHGWDTLAKANPDVLGPLSYQTAEFDPGDGRGVFIRLLAGPFEDRAKANDLCKNLQGKRVFCRVLSLGPA
jgi:hypothetical protein